MRITLARDSTWPQMSGDLPIRYLQRRFVTLLCLLAKAPIGSAPPPPTRQLLKKQTLSPIIALVLDTARFN